MENGTKIIPIRKGIGDAFVRQTMTRPEKRPASYYLPIIFLIALLTVIAVDILNG